MENKNLENKIKKYDSEGYEKIVKDFKAVENGQRIEDQDIDDILLRYKNVQNPNNDKLCYGGAQFCRNVQQGGDYDKYNVQIKDTAVDGNEIIKIASFQSLREAVLKANMPTIEKAEEHRKLQYPNGV